MAGTENQCIAVAEALGISYEIKRISLHEPWKTLSPYIGFEQNWSFSPALTSPWPDLLIASGRKSIAASRYIKTQSGGKTFTVQIQDPRINPKQFDLVAVPAHDPLASSGCGDNVIVTDASPNRITQTKLDAAKREFPSFESFPSPRIAVLIGGNSKAYTLTPEIMERLCAQLKSIDGGLMITASRRTGAENEAILKKSFHHRHPVGNAEGISHERDPEKCSAKGATHTDPRRQSSASQNRGDDGSIFLWDGQGQNPYFAMLAWADFILVTADSASMLSDACSTGKPVYMIPMDGGHPRIDKLHERLQNLEALRVFDGNLEPFSYDPLNDAQKIACAIKERIRI